MSLIQPNTFTSYKLSDQEKLYGTILTTIQKHCIQNQISDLAIQKLNLEFDPVNPQLFLQQEASLKGQLIALQYLITLSENAEMSINQASLTIDSQEN